MDYLDDEDREDFALESANESDYDRLCEEGIAPWPRQSVLEYYAREQYTNAELLAWLDNQEYWIISCRRPVNNHFSRAPK